METNSLDDPIEENKQSSETLLKPLPEEQKDASTIQKQINNSRTQLEAQNDLQQQRELDSSNSRIQRIQSLQQNHHIQQEKPKSPQLLVKQFSQDIIVPSDIGQEKSMGKKLSDNKNDDSMSNSLQTSLIKQKQGILCKQQSQKSLASKKKSELNISQPTQSEHQQQMNQQSLETHLKNQIQKYNQLLETRLQESEKEKKVLQKLIKTCMNQLEKLNQDQQPDVSGFGGISLLNELQTRQETFPDLNILREKNLKKIFDFYCQVYYTKGNQIQFGRIYYESHILTEDNSAFQVSHFNYKNTKIDSRVHHNKAENHTSNQMTRNPIDDTVLTHKWWLKRNYVEKTLNQQVTQEYRILEFKELNQLFKKHFNHSIEIDFPQFLSILPKVANLMFFNKENAKDLLFSRVLKIDDNQYLEYLKNIHIPFNSKEQDGFRQPQIVKPLKALTKSELQEKKHEVLQWQDEKRKALIDKMQQSLSTSKSISQLYAPSYFKAKDYGDRGMKLANYKLSQRGSLLDWEILEQQEFKFLLNDGFRPSDLIEEQEDDDDRYYLKEYSIKPQRQANKSLEDLQLWQNGQRSQDIQYNNQPQGKLDKKVVSNSTKNLSQIQLPKVYRQQLSQNQSKGVGTAIMKKQK